MSFSLTRKLLAGFSVLFSLLLISSCNQHKEQTLFKSRPSSYTGIDFTNQLRITEELNPYTFRNFYNGGGVAVGDINNDGLVDIYFTGNQIDNRLYLNLGDLKFEDITAKAGVAEPGVWSTGAEMVDINGDGLMDIYVTKSGSPGGPNRHNELFINNGDLTFTESAKKYGLDVIGLSTDAAFFDYDRDGDLDMYLLNNSMEQLQGLSPTEGLRREYDSTGGDQLFRNDMDSDSVSTFTAVTKEAGIYSSKIGFGLDVAVSDINKDGWPDLYISNDFFERDYLYLNKKDGTFVELLPELMPSISLSSMGADIADINHDGYPDIFVTDMLPEDESRVKSKTKFDTWREYQNRIKNGYHYQFVRNTLQLNNGEFQNVSSTAVSDTLPLVTFSEISRLANTEATDWSWATLIADYNNDGDNDIFVTNGIVKDLTDQDYVNDRMNMNKLRSVVEEGAPVKILFEEIPSTPLSNYAFAGTDSLHFVNRAKEWGLDSPGFSSGAAYADLDNDGDLDLIINNNNAKASLFENQSNDLKPTSNWLTIELEGISGNTSAIGAKLKLWANGELYYREQFPGRGFQSSVDHRIHFGIGEVGNIDSLSIWWPHGQRSMIRDIEVNQMLTIRESDIDTHNNTQNSSDSKEKIYENVTDQVGLTYSHQENEFVDFKRNKLLTRKLSTQGPPACVADINGDGLDDLYIGGAKGQPGAIFVQQGEYNFTQRSTEIFEADAKSEDTDCIWFDANGDEYLDLYVTSGGSEFPASSSALEDRLYLGEQNLSWQKSQTALPTSKYESASVVKVADFNKDGHTDLFTGSRLRPFAYGLPVNGNLLLNDGEGNFQNITKKAAPELVKTGLINDAAWVDYDNDGDVDLVVAGEWMPIRFFENQLQETGTAEFVEITEALKLGETHGLWQTIATADLDSDGFQDVVLGNMGNNTRYKASREYPLQMWINDFDENGSIDQIKTFTNETGEYPIVLRDDLLSEIPSLSKQIPSYKSYSEQSISELFSASKLENAKKMEVKVMESIVLWNNKGQDFQVEKLPQEAQFSPMFGIHIDKSSEETSRILTGGNLYRVKPEIGRYDASYGSIVEVEKDRSLAYRKSTDTGFELFGEVRGIYTLKSGNNFLHLVPRNNNTPLWFIKKK